MSDVLVRTGQAGLDPSGLLDAGVLAFDFADHMRAEAWNSHGQGWMKSLVDVDDAGQPKYAYLDMTTTYATSDHLRTGEFPHVSMFFMTERGMFSVDNREGILADKATGLMPTPEDAATIAFSAINRLSNRTPGIPYQHTP